MIKGWTIKDFLVFILLPLVIVLGGGWLIAWMSPAGVGSYVVIQLSLFAVGVLVVGAAVKRQRGRARTLDDFLSSIPRWGWSLGAGVHAAVLGFVLGLALQAPLMPMMLGSFAVAAVAGAVLPICGRR